MGAPFDIRIMFADRRKPLNLKVSDDMSIKDLKRQVKKELEDDSQFEYMYSFSGKAVDDVRGSKEMRIEDYNIMENSQLFAYSKLKGGRV
jgi:hypothetical protein